MTLIEQAVKEGIIAFNSDKTKITYSLYKATTRDWGTLEPEEEVRADLVADLIFNYGYKKENIDIEVPSQQGGSGKSRADIVIYHPKTTTAFAAIEVKAENTKDDAAKIYRQARSYGKSEELKTTQFYASKVGNNALKVYTNHDDKQISKFPYNYTEDKVYAFIDETKPLPTPPPHYLPLNPSTPYDLKRIFKQCHDIIWNRGERNAQIAFDEFCKLLFLKMADELARDQIHLERYIFQTYKNETAEELGIRIKEEYNKEIKIKKVDDILTPIHMSPFQIYEIVSKLESISLIETDNDPKGLAFETFKETHMKGEFGQYFTPRNIVKFMLDVSPIVYSSKFRNKSNLLDPCCGSGSFLVHGINAFRKRYPKKEYWSIFANQHVLGIELNKEISVTAKINVALHDDGHDNIKQADGLNAAKVNIGEGTIDTILTNPPFGTSIPLVEPQNPDLKKDLTKFYDFGNFVLTQKKNNAIDDIREELKHNITLAFDAPKNKKSVSYYKNIDSEIIFFELYYKLLKADGDVNGIANIVIPDGILTNSSSQRVRDYIMEHFRVLAVISLPQFTFSHYGAGVKSSIIIIKKRNYTETKRIQSAKHKYLTEATKQHVAELDALDKEKKIFADNYIDFVKLRQTQADEVSVIQHQLRGKPKDLKKQLDENAKFYADKFNIIKSSPEFQAWKKAKDNDISERIDVLYAHIAELATFDFNKFEKDLDKPIFMAIAEHIGYDATGRETNRNDLDDIGVQLQEFLIAVENNTDSFFVFTPQ